MNSALKPVLPQQPGGQASPAKGNVANANHTVGLPQGAQNSLHHPTNSLVGQNLTHHAPSAPQLPPHAVPSMAPVSANMAQMAQNMSHHGNLSHVTQNSVAPTNMAASPNKSATTSAPLSLVAEKPQPLALTRTPEKKEPDSSGQANGTVDSPKSAANAPAALKPQNPEPNKEKQDIAKTSPSTPKPPEKPTSAVSTPQKPEPALPVSQVDGPAQPKVATANEAPEKSPSKPAEPKPAPTADVAPMQSDSKPVPESANDSQLQDKPPTPQKPVAIEPVAATAAVSSKSEIPAKPEEKKEEPKVEPSAQKASEEKKEEVKVDKPEPPKKEEPVEKLEKPQKPDEKEKTEEKKPEPKPPVKPVETKAPPKSTLKLATVTPQRKKRQASPKSSDGPSSAKKAADGDSTPDARTKRNRTQVQLYQSPTPELTMATKLSASAGRATPTKPNDDKLIVFYKNEYLAVRNAEGGFYVCQAMQNVYRTTRKIKIRWLSQDKAADPSGETYKPDFYDVTDMECVLTTLSMSRAAGGGGAFVLRAAEEARARSILQRALRAEQGAASHVELTEEHPDGLDLSLYTDESQLEKKSRKRTSSKTSPRAKPESAVEVAKEAPSPAKKARTTPKRSPKSAQKPNPTPSKQNNKRKSAGSTPIVASTSKTATAVTEKKAKSAPAKRTPVKPAPAKQKETPVAALTPTRKGRRAAAKESKPSPAAAPTPSTSTGKSTRTPRKPPAHK